MFYDHFQKLDKYLLLGKITIKLVGNYMIIFFFIIFKTPSIVGKIKYAKKIPDLGASLNGPDNLLGPPANLGDSNNNSLSSLYNE